MTLDPQLAAVLAAMAGSPALTSHPPVAARALFEQVALGLQTAAVPLAEVGSSEDTAVSGPAAGGTGTATGVPVRIHRPVGPERPRPTVVFVHGGGWVIGSIATHDDLARRLSRDLDAVVVSVGYRLAPEDPFPAGLDDCTRVLEWAAAGIDDLGGDPARIAVAGDSAGGNLCAVLAQHARDTGVALATQLLFYPATDLTREFGSMSENAEGYFLTRADTVWFAGHYLGGHVEDPTRVADPRVSPACGDLTGLAPAVVVTAGFDPLRDAGEAYADALATAGVPVVRRRFDELIHGFANMTGLSAACEQATAWTLARTAELLQA